MNPSMGVEENWQNMKRTMQDILNQLYAIRQKGNEKKIWGQKGFEHAAENEKAQYQTLVQERQKHMKAIVRIDKKITKLVKQNILRKTFIAWKAAHLLLTHENQT